MIRTSGVVGAISGLVVLMNVTLTWGAQVDTAHRGDLAQTAIAAASAAVALAAFFLSFRTDARGAAVVRTQLFLDLRTRFIEVFRNLPRFDKAASEYTAEERAAVLVYWHHAFDEWYVTNRLNERQMKDLWQDFYAPALVAGMRHEGFRQVLFEMIDSSNAFGEYRRSFGDAMKRLWESRDSLLRAHQ